ncbi:MAG: energy transducer TonB [Halobacteriovoraceae bacterium]|nr:energy transducer TonB [Halobacteriovoraceae bacterium]MCB9094124.1 energy transducer TonB [Halobacteriovoraceae bacterium]
MFFKKKKLLNVKYKRKPDSVRLLDKQFSITDRSYFKINVKGTNYYFQKTSEDNSFYLHADGQKNTTIPIGGSVKLQHKDGTEIFFDLYQDFMYSIDYGLWNYIAFSVVLNLIFALSIPDMSTEIKKVGNTDTEVDQQRVSKLLDKIQKKEEPPKPKPEPKVVEKPKPPEPKPKPKPKVVQKPKPQPKKIVQKRPQPRKRSQLLSENPRPNPKVQGRTKVTTDRRKMKRLVVEKGPPVRGGTGPRNPNATKNTAARSQARKIAQTKAKVANALNFLSKGKGDFNIPPGAKGGTGFVRQGGGKGLAGAKNVEGKNFLAKISDKDVIGSSTGPIKTSGSRTIATGPVVSDGEINGVANGKSLNYVQGKVSVQGLHSAGGSGNFAVGPQSMTVKGGKISESLIRKIIQANMKKFVYCYEKALLTKPGLQGVVELTWGIVPGGRVSSARVTKSALNDNGLHGCLTGVIKKLSFSPGPTGGPATVTYPFNFTSSML